MSEETETTGETPSRSSLFKSALIALVAAIVATVLFVMPAEYGVDPTGVGEALGLTALADIDEHDDEAAPPRMVIGAYPEKPAEEEFDYFDPEVLGEPYSKGHSSTFKSETITINLDVFEQVEYKAVMQQGDAIVYSWSVEKGTVYTDFHADPGEGAEGYPEGYYIRYRESETPTDAGSLVAPFEGNHGWYWLNIEETPIRITLNIAGYYERVDELFRSYQ